MWEGGLYAPPFKECHTFFTKTTNVTNVTNVTLFLGINYGSGASTSFPSTACFSLSLSRKSVHWSLWRCKIGQIVKSGRKISEICSLVTLEVQSWANCEIWVRNLGNLFTLVKVQKWARISIFGRDGDRERERNMQCLQNWPTSNFPPDCLFDWKTPDCPSVKTTPANLSHLVHIAEAYFLVWRIFSDCRLCNTRDAWFSVLDQAVARNRWWFSHQKRKRRTETSHSQLWSFDPPTLLKIMKTKIG